MADCRREIDNYIPRLLKNVFSSKNYYVNAPIADVESSAFMIYWD